jgi:hypothetical protein
MKNFWRSVVTFLAFSSSFALLPLKAWALEFIVIGVRGEILLEQNVEGSMLLGTTVGKITHRILTSAFAGKSLQEYQGSYQGVRSINFLGSALEVLSDREMLAYGWCYQIDGKFSDRLAHEYVLNGKENQMKWTYSFARFDTDRWVSMCEPATRVPPKEE